MPEVTQRRLLVTVLAHGHCSASDKALALLHALWLEYGPEEYVLRALCASARGIPTDFGPESLIANARDVLPRFYGRQGTLADLGSYLFPHALRLPGWNHAIDSCI